MYIQGNASQIDIIAVLSTSFGTTLILSIKR